MTLLGYRLPSDMHCVVLYVVLSVVLGPCHSLASFGPSSQNIAGTSHQRASEKPHIILIVADDLGYNDVGFHGSDQIPTPNIDFLAYNGIILNNYYVSPICTPTRSALLTGKHPIHTGLQHSVISGSEPYGLPLNETLLPQYLNKLGYRTHMVGKWHLGFYKWQYTPLYRGFESHLGYYQGCGDYYTHTYEHTLDQWALDYRQDKTLLRNCTGLYSTTMFRDEAVRIIENHNQTEPLFLYLPFQAVHSSNKDGQHLQAPEEYVEKFSYIQNTDRRTYAAMVSALDDAIGDVYDTLKATGMLHNSIIVFTTDNGGPPNGYDLNAANNFPLRGGKNTLWEGGVRGVGLVHSPLLQHQGYVSNQLLHVCDWLPTLVSAAGGKHGGFGDKLATLDGVDAWSMLSTDGASVRSELLHNIDPVKREASLRLGDFKLLVGNINTKWADWYPPYLLAGDEERLHYLRYSSGLSGSNLSSGTETEQISDSSENMKINYRTQWPTSVVERMRELYTFAEESYLYRGRHTKLLWRGEGSRLGKSNELFPGKSELDGGVIPVAGKPVKIKCGAKPGNASTNCQPSVSSACLYHIASDPCEYNNIAAQNPHIVSKLLSRLKEYTATMVPVLNKPLDPKGNPRLHDGAWMPWE